MNWIDSKSIDLNLFCALLPRNHSNEQVVGKCTHPTHVAEFKNLILGLNEWWNPVKPNEVGLDRVGGGLEPDLLDEVTYWIEKYWTYALFAAVAIVRACADRAGTPLGLFVADLATQHAIDLS